MGIFLKKRGNGYDPRWHGSWQVDGVRKIVALNLWRGTPPAPGEEEGDAKFERSKGEAERLFKRAREGKKSAEEELVLAQNIHAARYGRKVKPVKIAELRAKWEELPHKEGLSAARRERVHSVLGRFERFMAANFPKVKECGDLTAEHFKGFFAAVDESGVSARTWNDNLDILRGTLRKVDGQGVGFRDYLARLQKRDEMTVHRRPFTGEELEAIYAAAAEVDPELHPVVVACACTALRRGDVARLRWEDVDMAAGFVTVAHTSKTGEPVEIPIFAPFAAVLAKAEAERRQGVSYVFPSVARAYKADPGALDRRLRKVLAAAGFARPALPKKDKGKPNPNAYKYPAPHSPADAVAMVDAGMRGAKWSEARRQKGLSILQRHFDGQDGRTIAAEMGIARGAVSTYLHDMEKLGEIALVSPAKLDSPRQATLAEMGEAKRKHRGSLCGWHSFRTTFCSLALSHGVPMELLTRITGHRTAEIVEKYYNQAKRAEARRVFGKAMPKAIAGAVEAAGAKGKAAATTDNAQEDLEAVPADLARVARMLEEATAEQREAIEAILKKGGDK